MKLNTSKMHRDILRRLNTIKKPQRYLYEKLGVARSTFWRLGQGKEITVDTFLKLAEWLDKDINEYIIHEVSKRRPDKPGF